VCYQRIKTLKGLYCKVVNQKLRARSPISPLFFFFFFLFFFCFVFNQRIFHKHERDTNRPPAWYFPLLFCLPFFKPTGLNKAKGAPLRCTLSGEVFPSLFRTGEPFSPLTPNAMQWGPALFPSVGKNLSREQQNKSGLRMQVLKRAAVVWMRLYLLLCFKWALSGLLVLAINSEATTS